MERRGQGADCRGDRDERRLCLCRGPTAWIVAAAVVWLAPAIAEKSQTALSEAEELQFVPAVVDVAPSSPSVRRQRKTPRRKAEPGAGMIEVEIDGVTVRVGRGADAKTVTAVLRALKAGA